MFSVKVVKFDDNDAAGINCAGDRKKHTSNANNADNDMVTMLAEDGGGGNDTPRKNGGCLNLRQRYKEMITQSQGQQRSADAVAAVAVGDITCGGGMHACTAAAIAATAVTKHDPLVQQPLREQKEEEDIIIDDLGRLIENAEQTLKKKLILSEYSSKEDDEEDSAGGDLRAPSFVKVHP